MNYDRIIIELLNRVQVLEEEVKEMKAEISDLREAETDINEEVNEQEGITRNSARKIAMDKIQKEFPDYLVETATRKEGGGIKVTRPGEHSSRPLFIKFYHSKTFEKRTEDIEHGWHVVRLDDVIGTVIDLILLSVVDKSGNWNFFLYTPNELGMYYDENRSGNKNILHLYFTMDQQGAKEIRENTIDVSDHLNNWSVLKEEDRA